MALEIRDIYVTALRNTHALELQALQIMERQIERLENYPEIEAALRNHVEETKGQRDRLDEALKSLSETPSALKEGVLGFVGNLMAMGHTPAQDEVLKNALANQAFENYEIAAYNALITIAEQVESRHVAAFQKSLQEEQRMADLVAKSIVPTTKLYLARSVTGQKADR